MAMFKAVVRTVNKKGLMPVYIRVTHNRKVGYIKTNKVVSAEMLVNGGEIGDAFVNEYCSRLIVDYVGKLNTVDCDRWSVHDVIRFVKGKVERLCFSDFARGYIDELIDAGRLHPSRNYRSALRKMERYFGTDRIMFDDLTRPRIIAWIESMSAMRRVKQLYPILMRHVFEKALLRYNDYDKNIITERLNEGLISSKAVAEVPIDTDDILSYCEMQKIVKACKEASERSSKHRFSWSNVPMEYVKSSPYLLSFMDTYELKQKIDSIYHGGFKGLPEPSAQVLLRENDIAQFHKIPMRNARMQYLRDMMLPKGKGAELLLWVPASRPYYTTNAENPFDKNKDFSKTLVFSAWEMVPRMIATLMTYEAEREVIFSKYKKAGYDKRTGGNRLKADAQSILTYPSRYLASLYNPSEHYGEKLHLIKANVRKQIKDTIGDIPESDRRNYGKILRVIEWLDNPELDKPEEMPSNTINVLTDMAIAAPGVCLYRILGDEEIAKETAKGFSTIFNRRISGYIIDKLQDKYHEDEFFLDGVMDYCVMGNLQAVLDEYRHLCSTKADFVEKMKDAFINVSTLRIDTDKSFGSADGNKFPMRVSYAVPFAKTKSSIDEKAEARSNNIRTAFQSPFYPFIVASTSVGQEGLDFHWYCRKIVHWNLPSNPQDLEQREGRINRYKCLAIRRNLAKIFPEIYDWDELFNRANQEVKQQFDGRYSGMVPNWCLPTEWIHNYKDNIEWIERIVPQYPMSSDVEKYRRLIDVLSLYRLTMGQPRQEELLEMLESQHLDAEQVSQLLFNLSPISRK